MHIYIIVRTHHLPPWLCPKSACQIHVNAKYVFFPPQHSEVNAKCHESPNNLHATFGTAKCGKHLSRLSGGCTHTHTLSIYVYTYT